VPVDLELFLQGGFEHCVLFFEEKEGSADFRLVGNDGLVGNVGVILTLFKVC